VRIFFLNGCSRLAAMRLTRQEAAGQERLFVADLDRRAADDQRLPSDP
jgi:hypothetical protein